MDGSLDLEQPVSGELELAVERLTSGNQLYDRELRRRIDARRYPTIAGRLTQGFFEGYGFSGVLIAFLARNNAIAAAIVAALIAMLFVTGQSFQIFYQIPFSMVQMIQAIIVMCVAASEFFIRHRIRLQR